MSSSADGNEAMYMLQRRYADCRGHRYGHLRNGFNHSDGGHWELGDLRDGDYPLVRMRYLHSAWVKKFRPAHFH